MKFKDIKFDCRYFKGHIPCRPHKENGYHCVENDGNDCPVYEKTDKKILIVKLGAIGDVIRTTPLFTRLKKEFPTAKFYWITYTPSVVPEDVDVVLKYDTYSIALLKAIDFDLVINLDKDADACAVVNQVNSREVLGFKLHNGMPAPANEKAYHKYLTGLFDDLNKENKKNYLEEIFEICGYQYNGEKYVLNNFPEYDDWEFPTDKKIVGLNTGCGGRWTSRLWPNEYWVELAKNLIESGYHVILLGGEQEDSKNKELAEKSGAEYPGFFTLEKFINLVDHCDLVVTAVTMAMHITLALEKKIVLFNNIFNPNEFELFGLGEIIQPEKECKCFFSGKCINDEYRCMESLYPKNVFETIQKLLPV